MKSKKSNPAKRSSVKAKPTTQKKGIAKSNDIVQRREVFRELKNNRKKISNEDKRIKFGRYEGLLATTVVKKDREYALWLVRNSLFRRDYKQQFYNRFDKYILSDAFVIDTLGIDRGKLVAIQDDISKKINDARDRRHNERFAEQDAIISRTYFGCIAAHGELTGLRYLFTRFLESDSDWRVGDKWCFFDSGDKLLAFRETITLQRAVLRRGAVYSIAFDSTSPIRVTGDGISVIRRGAKITVVKDAKQR